MSEIPKTDPPVNIKAPVSKNLLLIILFLIVVSVGIGLIYFLTSQKNNISNIKENSVGPISTITAIPTVISPTIAYKEEYQNPFDKKEQYQNPFDNIKQ